MPEPPALKVCHVASEAAPFAKTGGLADVTSALCRNLVAAGCDVRLFLPMYRRVRQGPWRFTPVPELQDVPVGLGGRTFHVSISTAEIPAPPGAQPAPDEPPRRRATDARRGPRARVWLVRCPELYERDAIYDSAGDEHLRFALLSCAAIESCQRTAWAPHVVHAHDWHAALLPLYLKIRYGWDRVLDATRTVLTIHNIGYQGVFPRAVLPSLDLEESSHLLYREDLEEGHFGFLKTGLLYADRITAVSRTYAEEIQTDELGMGLGELLRERRDALVGIVNGVEYGDWDPAHDPWLPARFDAEDLTGKAACKRALLERFGLDAGTDPAGADRGAPLVGVVSRLVAQKGFELLPDSLPVLLQRDAVRLVVLGSGEERYERYFDWLRDTYPGRVGFHAGYDEPLAHLVEAGSDLFLMPSRYEPCGLNQMYSLRYGAVPVVRRTGGLADTVEPFDPATGAGTGFLFDDFRADALLGALEHALAVRRDPAAWTRLMRSGMARDLSWTKQVRAYLDLYAGLVPAPT